MSEPVQPVAGEDAITPPRRRRPKRRRVLMAVMAIVVIAAGGTAYVILGGGMQTSHGSAELAYAHCMQTHGVSNWPDPKPGGPLVLPSGLDRNSPSFRRARAECQSQQPNRGVKLP